MFKSPRDRWIYFCQRNKTFSTQWSCGTRTVTVGSTFSSSVSQRRWTSMCCVQFELMEMAYWAYGQTSTNLGNRTKLRRVDLGEVGWFTVVSIWHLKFADFQFWNDCIVNCVFLQEIACVFRSLRVHPGTWFRAAEQNGTRKGVQNLQGGKTLQGVISTWYVCCKCSLQCGFASYWLQTFLKEEVLFLTVSDWFVHFLHFSVVWKTCRLPASSRWPGVWNCKFVILKVVDFSLPGCVGIFSFNICRYSYSHR